MTSPGGVEVSRVSIRVVPDTSGFRARLRTEIERAIAGLDEEIDIGLNLDADGLRQRVRAALAGLDEVVNIRLNLEQGALRADLRSLVERAQAGVRARVEVQWGTSAAVLRNELRLLVARASAGVRADVEVNVNRDRIPDLGSMFSGGGSSGGGLFGILNPSAWRQIIFYMGAATTLAGPLVAAGAALTAAWGFLSTAIAAVPAALGLVAIPAIAIAAGFDEIKRNLAALKPEILGFQIVATKAFAGSFAYIIPNLRMILRGLIFDVGLVAQAVGDAGVSFSNMANKAENFKLLLS